MCVNVCANIAELIKGAENETSFSIEEICDGEIFLHSNGTWDILVMNNGEGVSISIEDGVLRETFLGKEPEYNLWGIYRESRRPSYWIGRFKTEADAIRIAESFCINKGDWRDYFAVVGDEGDFGTYEDENGFLQFL